MKRLALSLLAVGLLGITGAVSAQSSYGDNGDDGYGYDPQPEVDRYGHDDGRGQYDIARVVRVDPVIERAYQPEPRDAYGSRDRCYSRQDGYYAGEGGDGDDDDRDGGYRGDDGYRGGTRVGSNVATVLGGVIGAVLGSHVGGGTGRYATTAVGTMVGDLAGRQIYDANHRYATGSNGTVTVCDPQPEAAGRYGDDQRVTGYDVTYEYAGRRYTTRTDYNPGDTIRVHVDVRPE